MEIVLDLAATTTPGPNGQRKGVARQGRKAPQEEVLATIDTVLRMYGRLLCVGATLGRLSHGKPVDPQKVRTGSIRPRALAALVLPLNPSVVWPNECLYWAACPALNGLDTVRRLVCTYRLTSQQPLKAADPYNFGGAFLCFGAAQSAASNAA
jgi:hypothetical protein